MSSASSWSGFVSFLRGSLPSPWSAMLGGALSPPPPPTARHAAGRPGWVPPSVPERAGSAAAGYGSVAAVGSVARGPLQPAARRQPPPPPAKLGPVVGAQQLLLCSRQVQPAAVRRARQFRDESIDSSESSECYVTAHIAPAGRTLQTPNNPTDSREDCKQPSLATLLSIAAGCL